VKIILLYDGMLQFGMAAANRIISYSKGLELAGADIEIISPFGFNSINRKKINKHSRVFGIKYTFLSFLETNPKYSFNILVAGTVLFYFKFIGYLRLLKFLYQLKPKTTIIIYRQGILYSFLIILFAVNKKIIFEICEIPFHSDQSFNKKILRFLQNHLNFKLANGFSVISNNLYNYLVYQVGISSSKIIKIPILTNLSLQNLIKNNNKHNNSIPISSIPFILHAGLISQNKDGILTIINAIGLLKLKYNIKLNLLLTGDLKSSSLYDQCKELIIKYDLFDNVISLGYLSDVELHELLETASLAIVYKVLNEQNNYCFPTKLVDYLTIGIPTIITNVGEMNNYIEDNVSGFVVDYRNTNQLVLKMKYILENNKKLSYIRENSKTLALKEFDYLKHGNRFFDFLSNLN
jgi:glycosyltransferase involved in cell wall biosynthesis